MAIVVLLFSFLGSAFAQSEFQHLLQTMVKKDPQFLEVDFRTPLYNSLYYKGVSDFFLPSVSLQYSKLEQHNNVSQVVGSTKYNVGSLVASLNLFSFGRDFNLMRASSNLKESQMFKVQEQWIIREAEIATLMFDFLLEKKNLEILEKIVALKERSLSISIDRYHAGALSQQERDKVKLDVSNARAELFLSQQNFNRFAARIKTYEEINQLSQFPFIDFFKGKNFAQFLSQNFEISNIPSYQVLNLDQKALDQTTDAKISQMFGNVSFNFSRSFLDFEDNEQWEWRTSLTYTLPLFDRFSQKAELEQARSQWRAIEVKKSFNHKAFKLREEVARKNLAWAQKSSMERDEALRLSTRLFDHSLNQFKRGQLSVNELLVDQDRLLRTEQLANQAFYQAHIQLVDFCHSHGKSVAMNCLK
jgi:outer membrane protein